MDLFNTVDKTKDYVNLYSDKFYNKMDSFSRQLTAHDMEHQGMDHQGMEHQGMDHQEMEHQGMEQQDMEQQDDDDVVYYEMPMYFWQGPRVIFVINGWESTDGSSYAIGCFLTLVFGFLLEGLIVGRTYLAKSF